MAGFRYPIAALALLLAAPALADDKNVQAATADPPEDIVVTGEIPDADKRVCKTQTATGSIIPKRTCRTKGEWEEMRARSLARLERMKKEEQERQFTSESRRNR